MNEEEAVKIFDLVVKQGGLPATLDKLVPLSFIGAAAVKFYQAKVKLMDQLGMSESQRKATLADGQDAGEMLLNIEARIGELAELEPNARPKFPGGGGASPSGELPKHERLGMSAKRVEHSQAIHRNPAAVKAVIAEAKENEDIPTKTAVLNKIKLDKEREANRKFNEANPKGKVKPHIEDYLESCIDHVVQINTVLKEVLSNVDQLDPKRLNHFIGLMKRTIEIINAGGQKAKWKQIT